jgi:hypothetical protein
MLTAAAVCDFIFCCQISVCSFPFSSPHATMLSEWSWGQRALWLPINDAQGLQTHTDRSLVSGTYLV